MPALGDDAPLPLLSCPPGKVIPLSSLREHPLHEAAMTTMRRIFINVLTIVISTRIANGIPLFTARSADLVRPAEVRREGYESSLSVDLSRQASTKVRPIAAPPDGAAALPTA